MSLPGATMSRRRLFPMLLLLCVSLLSIHFPSVVSSPLSFDVQFTKYGFDPQMVLFHQKSPKNISDDEPYTAHRGRQVLPRKKKNNFVPATCDCSRIDGVMYARPAPLRAGTAADDEVASFKMTLCLKLDRAAAGGTKQLHGGGRIGLFLFLVPYPWNARDERIEVGLDNNCTEALLDSVGGSEAVVCGHLQYDSATELLLSTVRIGDGSCTCGRKLDRSGMPRAAAVGFGSVVAGDPINWGNILTWAFHSTLEWEKDHHPRRITTR